jgi:cytochrome c oxidase subunit 1
MRWVTTTNHKDIGTMYLWFSFAMFMVGGVMALIIRTELFQPGLQVVEPEFFNQMTTLHGLIMVFGAIMPAFVGFANWQIPMMIGAPDMAFPRMNNWSFWLLPPAGTLLVLSMFVPGGSAGVGWTMYAPLTVQQGMGMDLVIFAVHILGMSSIMGSINIVTTILNMRARHDDDEDAVVRVDLADHRVSVNCRHAGSCWCGDDDTYRSAFRNAFL